MARAPHMDRRYLEFHHAKWRVSVPVPRDLHQELGSRLKKQLQTDSLAVANSLKWPIVTDFRAVIAGARKGGGKDPMRQEAIEIAEYRSRAQTEGERDMVDEGIRHRAEDLLGSPVHSSPDPMTGEPTYEYDPGREARADAFAAIAFGEVTPLELHHDAFVAQSTTKSRTKADDRRAVKYLLDWCERKGVRPTLQAITHRCHILETGNDSFRFKNSSAKAAKPAKEKTRNLTNA